MDVVQGVSLHDFILSTVLSQKRLYLYIYTGTYFVTQPPSPYQGKTNNQVKLVGLPLKSQIKELLYSANRNNTESFSEG